MQHVIITVNPHAASGRAGRVWERLRRQAAVPHTAHCITASSAVEARRALLRRLQEDTRRVIAIGGDGTLHHVANTLLECRRHAGLGLIPVGSGSDTARGLGLQRRPGRALQAALAHAPEPMDVVRFQQADHTGWVVNIASFGISGAVASGVNGLRRRWAGTYLCSALSALAGYAPPSYRIHLDGRLWFEGPILLCAVANGSRFARGMRIAPTASPHDGLIDVVVVRSVPAHRVLPWLPTLYTGGHMRAPFIDSARARHVLVEPLNDTSPMETDGECRTAVPTEFTVEPRALGIIR